LAATTHVTALPCPTAVVAAAGLRYDIGCGPRHCWPSGKWRIWDARTRTVLDFGPKTEQVLNSAQAKPAKQYRAPYRPPDEI